MKYLILLTLAIAFIACSKGNTTESKKENDESSRIDSLRTELRALETRLASIEFLTTGEMIETDDSTEVYGYSFRIEIRQSEIYRSLFLTKVEYYGESHTRVVKTVKVDIEKILDLNEEETSALQFKAWLTPSEFEVSVGTRTFALQIPDIQNLIVTRK